jgi:predicted phosphodiesterase
MKEKEKKFKILAAGDLHGDIYLMRKIQEKFSGKEQIIFLGDFLDSFRYDIEDQVSCVKLALEMVETR